MALIFEETTDVTLLHVTDLVDAFLLFAYGNGNSPQTQSMAVDDVRVATTPPSYLP